MKPISPGGSAGGQRKATPRKRPTEPQVVLDPEHPHITVPKSIADKMKGGTSAPPRGRTVAKITARGNFQRVAPPKRPAAGPIPPNRMDSMEYAVRVLPRRNHFTVSFMSRWWVAGKVKAQGSVFIGEFGTEQEAQESTAFKQMSALIEHGTTQTA